MPRKRAVDGIQDLIERTGGPAVKSRVLVNQPYAQDQHETLFYRHAGGGQAKYLEEPLFANTPRRLQKFADRLLMRGRLEADRTWHEHVGEPLIADVRKLAPRLFGDLAESAAVTTYVGGRVAHKTLPVRRRLTQRELDIKDMIRNAGPGGHE